MNRNELKELLKESLSISISHDRDGCDYIQVSVYFDGELITEDYCGA